MNGKFGGRGGDLEWFLDKNMTENLNFYPLNCKGKNACKNNTNACKNNKK